MEKKIIGNFDQDYWKNVRSIEARIVENIVNGTYTERLLFFEKLKAKKLNLEIMSISPISQQIESFYLINKDLKMDRLKTMKSEYARFFQKNELDRDIDERTMIRVMKFLNKYFISPLLFSGNGTIYYIMDDHLHINFEPVERIVRGGRNGKLSDHTSKSIMDFNGPELTYENGSLTLVGLDGTTRDAFIMINNISKKDAKFIKDTDQQIQPEYIKMLINRG
jgi:hypothetical protein